MPDSHAILSTLSEIANEELRFAVAWHLATGVLLFTVLTGFRPTRRALMYLLCLPLASVAIFAWTHGSSFNALVFALLTVAQAVLAARAPDSPAERPASWLMVAGLALIAFAWVYPHFLSPSVHPFAYLIGAPMGLVPCPTLALVTGVMLLSTPQSLRASAWVVAGASVIYGLLGAVVLGVWMDLILLVGGVTLLSASALPRVEPHVGSGAHPAR